LILCSLILHIRDHVNKDHQLFIHLFHLVVKLNLSLIQLLTLLNHSFLDRFHSFVCLAHLLVNFLHQAINSITKLGFLRNHLRLQDSSCCLLASPIIFQFFITLEYCIRGYNLLNLITASRVFLFFRYNKSSLICKWLLKLFDLLIFLAHLVFDCLKIFFLILQVRFQISASILNLLWDCSFKLIRQV